MALSNMDVTTISEQILHHWVLLVFALSVCYFVGSAIYNLYFSPLAKYPGPFFAKISGIPTFYHAITGYHHIWLWQCHQLYGDVVRVHPTRVSINSATAVKTIFGARANVKKAKFYNVFSKDIRHESTLFTTDVKKHARKKRSLNALFSDKNVREAETFVAKHVDRWCELLVDGSDGKEWTEAKNISHEIDFLVFDIISELFFGKSFELKEPGENPLKVIPETIPQFAAILYTICRSPFRNFWVWMKPHGLDALFEKLMPTSGKLFYGFLADAIAEKISIEESQKKLSSKEKDAPKDMFHYLYHLKDPETGAVAFAGEELHAEAFLMQSAGSDTTSTCLSSFFFYITRYPLSYKKITTEIRSAFQNVEEIRTGPKLTACQYLRACIDEAMRIGPPGTSDAPREVLPGGITVDGNFFPEGTDIGCPLYAMNHKESHYPDPNIFRPERWIVDENTGVTAEDVASAKAAFNPFQLGPGVCPGRALAINEQLLVIARTLFLMDVKLAPGDESGAMKPEFGWGRSSKNKFDVKDAYISIRDGPMVQLRKRVV